MAGWIFSWSTTTWMVWFYSVTLISAIINWNADIIATPEERNLSFYGPLWTYFGSESENVSIFHSREYMQERVGKFMDVNPERIFNHNYLSMTAWLKEYATKYPNITWLYSIGKSVKNRTLWVLAISRTPRIHRLGVPEVRYVANMHGNEVVGREAMLYLIALLCDNYGKNRYLTNFVNNMRIHIMPSINPDGYEVGVEGDRMGYTGRSNDHGVDLNRNFPARFPSHRDISGGALLEKETIAAMKWFRHYPFVLSANFHGGSLVANYPYDDSTTGQGSIYSPTLDDRLFVALSYSYARAHSNMWKTGRRCGLKADGDFFLSGITNGAFWYPIAGGMQDWQYVNTNCFEITVEMGCYKFALNGMLPKLWDEHKYSLLAYMEFVHRGIKGFVLDQNGYPVKRAVLSIGQGKNITTTDEGEFWRLLLPGAYTVSISHEKYLPKIFNVTVDGGSAKIINVTLVQKPCGKEIDGVRVRGDGVVLIAVSGLDLLGNSVVQKLADVLCSREDLILQQSTIHLLPSLPTEHVLYLKDHKWAVLLLFGQGLPKSTIFNAGINSPRQFDEKKLNDSLVLALNNKTGSCVNYMLNEAVSSMFDALNMTKTFQLGVSLGCSLSESKSVLTAATVVVQTVSNVFAGAKTFAKGNSTTPTDLAGHVSPTKMAYDASDFMQHIEQQNCAVTTHVDSMEAIIFDGHRMPQTVVMAVEQKTSSMIYEFAADLCSKSLQDGAVRELLNASTLILIPSIPFTQPYCHDYVSLMQIKPFVEKILDSYSLVDYVILLGTGGMKVRYSDASRLGRAKDLAFSYVSQHSAIKPFGNDSCPRSDLAPVSTVSELREDMKDWQKPRDILFVQTACCYQGDRDLYAENKASLLTTLSKRIQGLSGTIREINGKPIAAPVRLKVGDLIFYTKVDGHYYIWLLPGVYTVDIYKENYRPSAFSIKIFSSKQTVHNIHLIQSSFLLPSVFKGENLTVTSSALFILGLVLIGLYRLNVAHKEKSVKRWSDGFERLPLNDFDSSASDDDDVVLDSTKSSLGWSY